MEICQQKSILFSSPQNFKDCIAWMHDSHESLNLILYENNEKKLWKCGMILMLLILGQVRCLFDAIIFVVLYSWELVMLDF